MKNVMPAAAGLMIVAATVLGGGLAHAQTAPGACAAGIDASGRCPTRYQYQAYAGRQPQETRGQKLARLVQANWEGLRQCQAVLSALTSRGGFALKPEQEKAAMGIKEHSRRIALERDRDPVAFQEKLDTLQGHADAASSFIRMIDDIGGLENFAFMANGVNAPQGKGMNACERDHRDNFEEFAKCAGALGSKAQEAVRQTKRTVAYFDETASVQCFRASGQVVDGMR